MENNIQHLIDELKNQANIHNDEMLKRKIITISKVPGAGGREIAELVAKKLELKIFEHTIITKLAEYTGTDKEAFSLLADVTGDAKDFWLYRIFGGGEISNETIRRHLTNVIQALAKTSDCILIGRGANVALKNIADVRVRIVAPVDKCIKRIMEIENCSSDEAMKIYNTKTETSNKFVKSVFDADLNNPAGFDIVINTENFKSFDDCADLIVNAFAKLDNIEKI